MLDLRFNDILRDHRGIYYYYVAPVSPLDIEKFGWNPEIVGDKAHIFVDISENDFVYLSEEEILYFMEYVS